MENRKVYSIILCIILVLVVTIPSFADEVNLSQIVSNNENVKSFKISQNEAEETLKKTLEEMFEIGIEGEKSQIEAYLNNDYKEWKIDLTIWKQKKKLIIHGNIDANNGKITNLVINEYFENDEKSVKSCIGEKEAVKIAENLVKKMNPKEIQEMDSTYNKVQRDEEIKYDFTYYRKINNIKYDNNFVCVSVNAFNGKVKYYCYKWDEDLEIPSLEDSIDVQKTEEIMDNDLDIKLKYISNLKPHYEDGYDEQFEGIKLVYEPEYSLDKMIDVDVKEGRKINRDGNFLEEGMDRDISQEKKKDIYDNAKKAYESQFQIDEIKGKEIIEAYINDFYGEGFEISLFKHSSMNSIEDWQTNNDKAMSAIFHKKDYTIKKEQNIGSITIDAVTGEVISIYGNDFGVEKLKSRLTWEEAYDKAIDAISKYFPSRIKDIETKQKYIKCISPVDDKEVNDKFFNFNFFRKINGIIYKDNLISIDIDADTGNIIKLEYKWKENIKFPKVHKIISEDKAKEIVTAPKNGELVYTLANKGSNENPSHEIKLVYKLMPYYFNIKVDAYTGKILDHRGNEKENN